MPSPSMAKCVCMAAATLAGLLGSAVAMAASLMPRCDVFEFYDVSAGECRHCDEACFKHENGTIISFTETRCLSCVQVTSKSPACPSTPDMLTRGDADGDGGGTGGLSHNPFHYLRHRHRHLTVRDLRGHEKCCRSAKDMRGPSAVFGCSRTDVNETSYVKLADPCDEVEIIDRVTCV